MDADSVVVVPGAKPIMFYAMLALVEPGDEVVYPDPGFPIYESMARYAGGTTEAATRSARRTTSGSTPTSSRRSLTPRTKLLVLNSPANPTGGVLTRSDMDRVAELSRSRPTSTVLTDEIYGRIVHDGEPSRSVRYPGMAERTIIARRLLARPTR